MPSRFSNFFSEQSLQPQKTFLQQLASLKPGDSLAPNSNPKPKPGEQLKDLKHDDSFYRSLRKVKLDDTMAFFHKLLVDKAKKDQVQRKDPQSGEPVSLEEFTSLYILTEIGSIKFASETLMHHLNNLRKNQKN